MLAARSRKLVLAGGLVATGFAALETLLAPDLPPGTPETPSLLVGVRLVLGSAFALFALAFIGAMSQRLPRKIRIALLALQAALGLTLSTDLLFVVAAGLPLVLSRRSALVALAALSAGVLLLVLIPESAGGFEIARGFTDLPAPLPRLLTSLWVVAFQCFAFLLGLLARTESEARFELEAALTELAATRVLWTESARWNERLTIARDLHDAVGHHLAGLACQLELAKRLADGRAREAVEEASAVARLLLADVRSVVADIRQCEAIDLAKALKSLAAGWRPMAVELDLPDQLVVESGRSAEALLRAAQEALTNAERHSGAREVRLTVRADGGEVRLEVRDAGRGAASLEGGNGLIGMRERLTSAGGRLEVETAAGAGFRLVASVPVRPR
ncbi:MAG: sensor histidine kinase [Thermoanaerobaculia bacterium]